MLIYLIDDNPDDRELERVRIGEVFPEAEIREFTEATEFAKSIETGAPEPALVVTDFELKWSNGIDVLKRCKARFPECPVVMFTGSGDEEIAVAAMKAGADDYVIKSARHFAQFRTSIRTVVDNSRQRCTIRETEAQLREALKQKELLLQELQHRTKNNLLTVMSLMRLRARRSDNPEVKEQLVEIAGRVQSLAQVQSNILMSDDLGQVDFTSAVADLTSALHRMYGNAHIALRTSLEAELVLPVQRAGPLALLAYEVILNSFKHAFPDAERGEVYVGVDVTGEHPALIIEDDGVGYRPGPGGMGTTLIGELAQEAEVEVSIMPRPGSGTRVEIQIRPESARENPRCRV